MDYLQLSEKIENMFLASSGQVVGMDVSADDLRGHASVLNEIGVPKTCLAMNMPEPLKSMPAYIAKGKGGAVDHISLIKGSTGAVVFYYDIFGGTAIYLLSKLNCMPDDLLASIKEYVDSWDVPEFVNASPVSVQ